MNELIQEMLHTGASGAAVIETGRIRFEPSLISLCEKNTCGNYATNWTCPPFIGDTQELIAKAKSYAHAAVFQKIYPLEDSFDIEGMTQSNKDFRVLTVQMTQWFRQKFPNSLTLSAGGCRICPKCAALEQKPCRHPLEAFASLESYSIQVSSLAEECGMKYINGQNTVTYFGAVLY